MVRIVTGENRRVIVIPSLKIVIKLPRVYWTESYRILLDAIQAHYKPKGKGGEQFGVFLRRQLFEFTTEHYSCLKRTLFGGIASNWREHKYYKRHKNLAFLQPTHFSLLGLLNVQRYGKPIDEENGESVYHAFFPIAGQDLIRDGHHWTHATNFTLSPKGPQILDYGGSDTQAIIEKYGDDLQSKFDLDFGRAQQDYYRSKRASS